MGDKFGRFFGAFGCEGWWIIVLFFLFLAFQDSCMEFGVLDWIPFLILLLICISCVPDGMGEQYYGCIDNSDDCIH